MKTGITTSERFACRYSDNELDEVTSCIMKVGHEAKNVFVMFNNHRSPGIQNAKKMKNLLTHPD
jgi:uncharacterized protein YecE (DUF72 family)